MNDLGAQRAAQPAGYDPVGYVPVNSEQGHLESLHQRCRQLL